MRLFDFQHSCEQCQSIERQQQQQQQQQIGSEEKRKSKISVKLNGQCFNEKDN